MLVEPPEQQSMPHALVLVGTDLLELVRRQLDHHEYGLKTVHAFRRFWHRASQEIQCSLPGPIPAMIWYASCCVTHIPPAFWVLKSPVTGPRS